MNDRDYPDPEQAEVMQANIGSGAMAMPRRRTVSENIGRQIRELEDRLEQLRGLQKRLDEHPEVREIVDELRKAGF